MSTITIPKTVEAAKKSLDGLGKLLTAKEWERAAIVYAFTDPVIGDQPASRSTGRLSIEGFAKLGITGLKSDRTVREYRKAWQTVIDDGQAVEILPGDNVTLPDRDWPPTAHYAPGGRVSQDEVIEGIRKMVVEDPKGTVQQIIQNHPEVISKLAAGVVATPGVRISVEAQSIEHQLEREARYVPLPRERDYSADVTSAVNLLIPALRAIEQGEWKPGGTQQMLLHFLGLLIDRAGTESTEPTEELFSEIERYLKEGKVA